ncbi:MAG: ABC transporter substrate-binding protein [Elusimicrobiota bacterium]
MNVSRLRLRRCLPAAFALLFAACGGDRDDRTVIRISGWSSSPEETRLLEAQLAEFESLRPDIKIKYEPIVGDYMQKIQVLYASRTEPDIFYLDSKDVARMVHYGVLAPLDGYLEEAGDDLTDYYEDLIETFRGEDGRLYGLPKGFSTLALYYNKDLFEKAGIGRPPRDWRELLDASRKLDALGVSPLSMTTDLKTIHLFAGLWGGELLERQKRIAFLDPPSREGLAALLGLFDEESGFAKLPQHFGGAWTGDVFAKSQTAMIMEGMWVTPYLQMRSSALRYGVAPIPRKERDYNIIFTVAYVLSSRSKHKKEAFSLVHYLTGPKGLMHVSKLGLEIPSRKSVVRKDFLARFPERKPFIDAVDHAVPFRYGIEGNRLMEEIVKAVEARRMRQLPFDEALERASEKLERFYETEARP